MLRLSALGSALRIKLWQEKGRSRTEQREKLGAKCVYTKASTNQNGNSEAGMTFLSCIIEPL